ncbi:FeoB-associated Cys-rich membrane protein [Lacrimispora aerotolerans]|jgi:hypothetical protein|uniref:FeoB-associated Cys-rich membrane protein n=1 Tax=Lacrimispora aerotolerans TaxID=36832 RepID=UPI000A0370F8|nr:FeoB-associated Cys-rich membrane protein [Lacrimispora aerotolerans]
MLATIVISALIAAYAGFIIVKRIKKAKQGESGCGCGCGSSSCSCASDLQD